MPRKSRPDSPEGRTWRFVFEYTQREREAWTADAQLLGFGHFGSAYLRWLLNGRSNGHLLINDPATRKFGEMIGAILGATAGEIMAKYERMYLDGH